ncbi:MAG: DNA polymerase III subunit alpha [Deltaproteobacteria bacterium]|nr:DNA polymerase III subunit alpha [Deltaproteobacteria bacterium]
MSNQSFVHLHLHTEYSLLDGAIKVNKLIEKALENEMPALAITDHGNMFGAIEFYLKVRKAGIKPILGCEVYVAPESRFDKSKARKSKEAAFHLLLLCQDLTGYKNLCSLVSSAYREGFYYRPRVDWELLREKNEGLIALTACLGGEIPDLILNNQPDLARQRAAEISEVFDNERFYLEIQRNFLAEQDIVNKELIKISREMDLPLVATNDCHYLDRKDAYAHEVLLCIQTGKTMEDQERMRFQNDEFYFKTPAEMRELFADIPEAVDNSLRIADKCNLEIPLGTYHFPQYEKPEDKTLDEILAEQARQGLDERIEEIRKVRDFSEKEHDEYRERLEEEIVCITQMGFPGYFLIVADFINWAKDHDIPVGPGRGSAAGSLVAFSLRITDIDPIRYQLLFERFLNPERVSMPDIDVDFCIHGREEVIRYVQEKYGKANVAQIITFGTMAARGVIRDVGRALNMPYGEVDRIAKLVPSILNIQLEKALKQEPRLKEMIAGDARVKKLFDVALALEGLTRHASTHAAGVVVTPMALENYLPLYTDPKSGAQVTQYSMGNVETIGLVKFDFLGLKTLTVINNAIRLIREGGKPDFDLRLIPDDDEATFQLLSAGETTGVFQLESSGMKELLVKLKPNCFEDIIALVALYRPGPLGSGMVEDFIQRKHGRKKITYEFKQLESVLKDTYGVILYQEQVMLVSQILANYSLGGADILRRAMGKKKLDVMAQEREKFLKGAAENKLDQKKAEAVFNLMEKFAEYGFNKSHSAAYALIAYQTAYLKAHYPVEFMAALLTEDMEFTDKVIKNISELRSMGIEILPPAINQSSSSFTVHENAIRFGLGAVKGVGLAALDSIIEVRKEKPFESLYDFCERVDSRKVNKKVIEALIKCGAFDSLPGHRSQLLAGLEDAMEVGNKIQREREQGQESLFETAEIISSNGHGYQQLPELEEWPEKIRLGFEKEALGFYITGHPMAGFEATVKRFASCDAVGLAERKDREAVAVCGIVASIKELTTKKGDRMAFVSLEDLSGCIEVVIFPEVYQAGFDVLHGEDPLLVRGNLDVGEENRKLIATEVAALADYQLRQTRRVHFRLSAPTVDEQLLDGLHSIVRDNPGDCEAMIHVVIPNRSEAVIRLPKSLNVAACDAIMKDTEKLFGYNVTTFE